MNTNERAWVVPSRRIAMAVHGKRQASCLDKDVSSDARLRRLPSVAVLMALLLACLRTIRKEKRATAHPRGGCQQHLRAVSFWALRGCRQRILCQGQSTWRGNWQQQETQRLTHVMRFGFTSDAQKMEQQAIAERCDAVIHAGMVTMVFNWIKAAQSNPDTGKLATVFLAPADPQGLHRSWVHLLLQSTI